MKIQTLFLCILTVVLLTACSPSVEHGADKSQPTPTVEGTPSTAPQDVASPSPTIPPKRDHRQEDTEFTYTSEGVEYTVSAIRHHSDRGYSMIYDPSIMTFGNNDQFDQFIVKAYDGLPAVQIRIFTESRSADAVIEYLKTIGAELSETMQLDGCEAVVLHYSEGTEYDDVVKTYYVVQAGDTVYLIENSFYQEAAEGFGGRMAQMVATIRFEDGDDTTETPAVTEKPTPKELHIKVRDKEVTDFTSVIGEVTTLQAVVDGENAGSDVQWTSSNESVCTVTVNEDGSCDVEIEGEGAAKVTAACGDLSASTVVRGKKTW